MEFKDYKEKQKYYKNRSRQNKMIWESSNGNKNGIIKGRTYVKTKEVKNDSNSK